MNIQFNLDRDVCKTRINGIPFCCEVPEYSLYVKLLLKYNEFMKKGSK